MVELPSITDRRIGLRDWVLDLWIGVAAIGPGALISLKYWIDSKHGDSFQWWQGAGGIVFTSIILILVITKAVRLRSKEKKFRPLDEPSCLKAWADSTCKKLERSSVEIFGCPGNIRVTIYKVHLNRRQNAPERLEQILYYSGGKGGPPGRRLSARVGIVGRAARVGYPQYASRKVKQTDKEYHRELVKVWGFLPDEATVPSTNQRSWLAWPIYVEEIVVAVMFADSAMSELFDFDKLKKTEDPKHSLYQKMHQTISSDMETLASTVNKVYN